MDASENSSLRFDLDGALRAPQLLLWCGTLTLVAMLRFHVHSDWVAAAWALLVIALCAAAWYFHERAFVQQAVFLAFIVLFRAGMHNFYERSYFLAPRWYSRGITVGATIVLLLAGLYFARRLTAASALPEGASPVRRAISSLGGHPDRVLFFSAVLLLTALLAKEFSGGNITIAWGAEAVAIFLFALAVGERAYRLTGLGLLFLCVGKIAVIDFWQLGMRDRAITFIVLGGALLLVSVLYTRKRELFKRWL